MLAPDHGFPTAEAVKIAAQNDRFRAGLLSGAEAEILGIVVTTQGVKLFWKIDLYDLEMAYGSNAPADPAQTRRVLTIMLRSDW